jgi:predicted nucleic acid-binding protein
VTSHAVIDASVVVKWLLRDFPREDDTRQAVALLEAATDGALELVQPPHWLAEVAAVVARLSPSSAMEIVRWLHALELPVFDDPEVYVEACRLAVRLDHHLFDTLYHAVAICRPDTICITADQAYYRKAHEAGHLVLLRDFRSH